MRPQIPRRFSQGSIIAVDDPRGQRRPPRTLTEPGIREGERRIDLMPVLMRSFVIRGSGVGEIIEDLCVTLPCLDNKDPSYSGGYRLKGGWDDRGNDDTRGEGEGGRCELEVEVKRRKGMMCAFCSGPARGLIRVVSEASRLSIRVLNFFSGKYSTLWLNVVKSMVLLKGTVMILLVPEISPI